MQNTPILEIPLIASSQAQKHVTHNEALMTLDALLHLSVVQRDLQEPPVSPSQNARYIVGLNPVGDWSEHALEIAIYRDEEWSFFQPKIGWISFLQSERVLIIWDGIDWVNASAQADIGTQFQRIAVNAPIDEDIFLVVKGNTILFTHDDQHTTDPNNIVMTMNKKTEADKAAILLQTNFQGRAEIGLNGQDDFSIKTSNDGANWKTAFSVDGASSQATIHENLLIGEGTHIASGLTISKFNPSISLKDLGGQGAAHSGVFSWRDGDDNEKAWMGLGSNGNTLFSFLTHYPDGLSFVTYGGSFPIEFKQHNSVRLKIHTNGNVGIHHTAPTTPLHVGGAIRVGTATITELPSPSVSGMGAIIMVSNEAGGPTLAFSDGTNWLRFQDRSIVT